MPLIQRSALVPYTPAQMFDVVNDVSSYPLFLPWCASSEVISESDTEMIARLQIAKGGLRQSFVTRNTLHRPESIRMKLVEGPFSHLDGVWKFEPVGDVGCRVALELGFEVDSRSMRFALGQVFSLAADKMVDAFCARADERYGAFGD